MTDEDVLRLKKASKELIYVMKGMDLAEHEAIVTLLMILATAYKSRGMGLDESLSHAGNAIYRFYKDIGEVGNERL